ncbi:MAG TPA: SctF chaperone SctG [Rhabdochlamydiaceae bacterium]|nr:SctF chaperone SctG [Rhabdochlamydiaceae bacterium]
MSMQTFKDDFILLCEAGFVAVNQADEDSANKLFRASELLNPDNALPKIGKGYLHLCKLELKQACKIFEEILAKDPGNEMAKTFLGLSFSLNPNEVNKGEKILEESSKKSKDPLIKKLAENAIDFVEKFVKKSPTPAHVQKGSSEKKKK